MMKFIYFIISMTLLTSCHTDNHTNQSKKILTQDSLTFFTGLPADMELHANRLFINDSYGKDGLVSVVDIDKDSVLFSFINKGNGPNEYVSLSNLNFYKDSNRDALGIFDVSTKVYRSYYVDSILQFEKNAIPFYSKSLDFPHPINQLFKTKNGYIANGFFPDGKFVLFDDSLNFRNYSGTFRPKPQSNINDKIHAQANLGKSRISPDLKHMATVIFSAGVVEYHSLGENEIKKEWEYLLHELDYKVENQQSIQNKGVEGFISVDITDDFVFALYSGSEFDFDAVATYGKYVYKFSLTGELIDIYELDREVMDIRVQQNKLYAIAHNPNPTVLIYDI